MIGIVTVEREDPGTGGRNRLPEGQLTHSVGGLVVALDRNDWCDRAQLIEHPQLADVAGVEQQVDSGQGFEDGAG